jgi:(p)ppGpp synthase/HD superfamily hydrolase
MDNDKDIDQLVELLAKLQRMNGQELARIEPIIRQAMASGIQDLDYLDRITDPLYNIVLSSGIGRELYDEYLTYVESFNPQRAKEYRNHDDELNGVYDDLVDKAAELAQEYHKGQVDKQGVDYFTGHLTTVGNAGHSWKEKIVGFLHDAAEDTPHTVDEIVRTLKEKSNGVLKDNDAQEISEALSLLNANTASTREEYIARIKESFIATKVKLNDLRHNMDISRISNPTDKDTERIKRYRREYKQVLEYLGTVAWEWNEDGTEDMVTCK